MQDVVQWLKDNGDLKVIDEALDVELEIPHVAYVEVKKEDSRPILFTKPVNKAKGIEYETQGAFRDQDNNLFKPDIIIRLPENKDVIVDSKVSLLAYEEYCSTEDDNQRVTALKAHTKAVREHIKGLSDKDYSGLRFPNIQDVQDNYPV